MVGGRGGSDKRRMYRCAAGLKTHRGEPCSAPAATSAEPLEALVREQLAAALAEHPGYEGHEEAADLEATEQALQEAEAERDAFLGWPRASRAPSVPRPSSARPSSTPAPSRRLSPSSRSLPASTRGSGCMSPPPSWSRPSTWPTSGSCSGRARRRRRHEGPDPDRGPRPARAEGLRRRRLNLSLAV